MGVKVGRGHVRPRLSAKATSTRGPLYFRMRSPPSLEHALDSHAVRPAESLPPVLTIGSARTHHNTKTDIVVVDVRLIMVADGGAAIVTIVVPRTAAQPEWRTPLSPSRQRECCRE